MYEEAGSAEASFASRKKVFDKLTKRQVEQQVERYSVLNTVMRRRFNNVEYSGMRLDGNDFYPHGYRVD